MLSKITLLFQATTEVTDRNDASPHTGGWSESWWKQGVIPSSASTIRSLAQKRAILLGTQAAVIGFRVSLYDVSGPKLIPKGTSTGKFLYPGSNLRASDLPQVALQMSGSSAGVPNSSRFCLRGMPDELMVKGEYQPLPVFKTAVTNFASVLISETYAFVGRVLTNPTAKVLSIAGAVATLDAALAGVAAGDYLRFNRVVDDDDEPVSGSYRVTLVAGTAYTLAGLAGHTLTKASGAARKDEINVYPFSTVEPARAVVRKVGRPFESYRGRASRR